MKLNKRPTISLEACGTRIVYPDHYSMVIVQNETERDNIPCTMRQNGMFAIVVELNYARFQIKTDLNTSICDNNSWNLVTESGVSLPVYVPGDNITIDYTDPLNPIISATVPTGIYEGNTPSTIEVGSLPSGTDLSGKTYDELLEELFAPYQYPEFISVSMGGVPTSAEVGTVFSGVKPLSFTLGNSSNLVPNSVTVEDVTNSSTLVSGASNQSPVSVNIGSVGINTVWRIQAENTRGDTISETTRVSFYLKRFFGSSSSEVGNSVDARSLPSSTLDNASTTFTLNTGSANTNFYVVLPSSRSLTSVFDLETNANVTAQYNLKNSSFLVEDAGGNTTPYKLYEMKIAVPFSSNHRHEIKIS